MNFYHKTAALLSALCIHGFDVQKYENCKTYSYYAHKTAASTDRRFSIPVLKDVYKKLKEYTTDSHFSIVHKNFIKVISKRDIRTVVNGYQLLLYWSL